MYGTAWTDSSAFILGGWIGTRYPMWRTSAIAQFHNNEWRKFGDFKEIKSDISAIVHGGEYLVIAYDS